MSWAPDYLLLPALKSYLGIEEGDTADDAFLAVWITTVSRNVDDFTGRQFGQVDAPEERYYTPVYDRHEGRWYATIDDLLDVTGLSITTEDGTAVTDYVLLPRNAAAKGRPYEQLRLDTCTGELASQALWGWPAQPAAVDTGMYLQAARLAKRRGSPFGISGSPSGNGQGELRLLAQLDPDFKTSLRPLVRKWWAA